MITIYRSFETFRKNDPFRVNDFCEISVFSTSMRGTEQFGPKESWGSTSVLDFGFRCILKDFVAFHVFFQNPTWPPLAFSKCRQILDFSSNVIG